MEWGHGMKRALLVLTMILFPLGTGLGRAGEPVTVSELLKTSSSWDGTPLPAYPTGKPEITIARIILPPGAQLPLHKHPMINAGVLLSGEITVITENKKTLRLKTGDANAEVVNQWHYGKNEGKVPAEIVVFYAGAVGMPITIKK